MGTGFSGSNDPTNSVKALKEQKDKGRKVKGGKEKESLCVPVSLNFP